MSIPSWTEDSFQGLIEAAPDAFVVVDSSGMIVLINSQAESLFGYARSELVGVAIERLIPERFHTMHVKDRMMFMQNPHRRPMGTGRKLLVLRKDGSQFYAEISLSPFVNGQEVYVTAVIRDVSLRIEESQYLERLVHERTVHLNVLLQYSQELLLAYNVKHILLLGLTHSCSALATVKYAVAYVFNAVNHMLEWVVDYGLDFNQAPVSEALTSYVLAQNETFQLIDTDLLPDWLPEDVQGVFIQPCQTATGLLAVFMLLQIVPTDFDEQAVRTLQGIANLTSTALEQFYQQQETSALSHVVSTLKVEHTHLAERLTSAEAAMLQSARLAAIGQLSASIAHEINNPLYAVRNSLELLEEDLPPHLQDSVYLNLAREQLARIARIIGQMRNFYRPSQSEFALVDINTLLRETLDVAQLHEQLGASVTLFFEPLPELPSVFGVADQLRQVFLNIVLNAIEAMPQGGTLEVKCLVQDSFVIIQCLDTGIGIGDKDHAKLFEPFFTTKAQGTGLGLSISAHIIQMHHGKIEIHSRQKGGSLVLVALPIAQRAGNT